MNKSVTILALQITLLLLQVFYTYFSKKNDKKKYLKEEINDIFKIKDKTIKLSRLNNLLQRINNL